jgi:hypothetical protein
MSTTATGSAVSRVSRTCVALTVVGWLSIVALSLPSGISSERIDSPAMEVQDTPVKAYPG